MSPSHQTVPTPSKSLTGLVASVRGKATRVGGLFWLMGSVVIGLAFAAILVSCATSSRVALEPPLIEGATFVGNKTCYECHTNIARGFPSSPHSRLHVEMVSLTEATGCEGCHGAGSKHVAAGGGRSRFIINPGRNPEVCFNCHLETHAQFNLPEHHPVREGKMNCVQCHDPHGRDIMKPTRSLAMARLNEQCASCHREQTRPFVFVHEALREACTSCHEPHGSINAKMLIERNNNLCLKCHAQTPGLGAASGQIYIGQYNHTARLRMGTCWSAGCHMAVHGSNIHPKLLY